MIQIVYPEERVEDIISIKTLHLDSIIHLNQVENMTTTNGVK